MASAKSALRCPLDHLLGTRANVRVLRVVARHGGALSTSQIAGASGLPARTARLATVNLERQTVLKAHGTERARVFSIDPHHPLAATLEQLFASESRRYEKVLEALRAAGDTLGPDALGVWLYGSVARGHDTPDSDLDVAIVTPPGRTEAARAQFVEAIAGAERNFGFAASPIAIDLDDVARLDADQDPWWLSVRREARSLRGHPPAAVARQAARNRTSPAAP